MPSSRCADSPFSAIGNGIPQSPGVRSRLIEKSSRPPRMKPSISLRRKSGWTKSGWSAKWRSRRSW